MIEKKDLTLKIGKNDYTIDRYAVAGVTAKRPVVVIVHGLDGMGAKSGVEIGKFARQIAEAGFLVFVPHYFDTEDGPDTASFKELAARRLPRAGKYPPRVAAAIDYALAQPEGDGRFGLVGLSLGGGLAVGYAESVPPGRVKALVDFFGFMQPEHLLNVARLPPTLILHNQDDGIVKIELSSAPLVEALKKTSVVHHLEVYDDGDPDVEHHPFKPGGDQDVDSRSRAVDWLKKYV